MTARLALPMFWQTNEAIPLILKLLTAPRDLCISHMLNHHLENSHLNNSLSLTRNFFNLYITKFRPSVGTGVQFTEPLKPLDISPEFNCWKSKLELGNIVQDVVMLQINKMRKEERNFDDGTVSRNFVCMREDLVMKYYRVYSWPISRYSCLDFLVKAFR